MTYGLTCPVCRRDSGLSPEDGDLWDLYLTNPHVCRACGASVDAHAEASLEDEWVELEPHDPH